MKYIISKILFSTIASSITISAIAETNVQIVDNNASYTMSDISVMSLCEKYIGQPYVGVADTLNGLVLSMVEAGGFDAERFSVTYQKKIEAYKFIDEMSFKYPSQSGDPAQIKKINDMCKTAQYLATGSKNRLQEVIKGLEKKSKNNVSNQSKKSADGCQMSADFYQERFRKSGKISDLTCFKKAGMRELSDE